MDGRELKKIWRSGKPSFGAWITSTDPAVAAVVCNIGYKWVLVDAEHNPYNPETLRKIITAVKSRGTVPIVRIADNSTALIKQILDLGAEGILVPLLRTANEVRKAVVACRYPPQGERGFNPRDASNYFKDLEYYRNTINERVIVMVMIERIEAVNDLDGFLATSGLDALLIGTADLSYSIGHPLQTDHPRVQEAINTIISKCNTTGMPVGIAVDGTAQDFIQWFKRGINFIPLGMDFQWISEAGGSILQEMRAAIGE